MVLNLTLNSLKAHPHTGLRADTPSQAHTNPQHPSPAHTHTHTQTDTHTQAHNIIVNIGICLFAIVIAGLCPCARRDCQRL